MTARPFPPGFVWGTAAAAYQIEGGDAADGRGSCVWDMFGRKPNAVFGGHTGAVACDHYHRWPEDIALMKALGQKAYRMSLSWPRILPQGSGAINEKGLGFYDRLIDGLCEAGIDPWITLFHWDYPYELFCRGGWLSPDAPRWFADYTDIVVDRFSDRVSHWITFNEPQCFIGLGHLSGIHAPGEKLGLSEVLRASHNVLLAHGHAVQSIRARSKQPAKISIASTGSVWVPETAADIDVARKATFAVSAENFYNNAIFSDPVFLGRYPEDAEAVFGAAMPKYSAEDMALIAEPLDFIGVNIYGGSVARRADTVAGYTRVLPKPGSPMTAIHWDIVPEALYWGPRFLAERYKLPLAITENGMAGLDSVSLDGAVHDPQRIDFTARYLAELQKATAEGVDVQAYFHWSVMDNFEWAEGYKQRFGLVHVDYETRKRTPKDSYYWYQKLIAANALGN